MSQEKTEQPTEKRKRDARKKGQVARSKEVDSTAVLAALAAYLIGAIGSIGNDLREIILVPTSVGFDTPFDQALPMVTAEIATRLAGILLPAFLLAFVAAVLGNVVQFGFLVSFENLKPQLKRLNPAENIKRIFSLKSVLDLCLSVVKVAVLGGLLYYVVKNAIGDLVQAPSCGGDCTMALFEALVLRIIVIALLAFGVVAAFDVYLERRRLNKQLMMTKDEVKREYKEMEGDPQIKSKRRQLAQQIAMGDMFSRMRKASVLVTNPTEIAVALLYDREKTPLPVIVAKGQGLIAERLIEIAKHEGIPIMQNVPLARALHETGTLEQYIPSELIEPVAEVLRWLQSLQQKR